MAKDDDTTKPARALVRLIKRFGRDEVERVLANIPKPLPGPGRPKGSYRRNAKIYQSWCRLCQDYVRRWTKWVKDGKRSKPPKKPSVTDAVRTLVSSKTSEEAINSAVKAFDGFSFDDPRRGWDKGRWYSDRDNEGENIRPKIG